MIQIKTENFTMQYDGPFEEAGLYDLIRMARYAANVTDKWTFGGGEE